MASSMRRRHFPYGEKALKNERTEKLTGTVLTALFALCLDVLAYWTRNDRVTPAGIIRLGIMVLLPLAVLILTDRKKAFLTFLAAVGLFSALHVLNCLRVGSGCSARCMFSTACASAISARFMTSGIWPRWCRCPCSRCAFCCASAATGRRRLPIAALCWQRA